LFSVGDLYTRLKAFQTKISDSLKPLYFVKVDVKAAFDTIPQASVIELMSSLASKPAYRISKHVEIKPGENYREDIPDKRKAKPMRKWAALARGAKDPVTFEDTLKTNLAFGKKNTIFVDNIVSQYRSADDLLDLLSEHVSRNMVKIGKKFYRQKEGIPQGSVLSSLLCNYFYADLESQYLGFLKENDSLLLRLIDDFLLITTSHTQARLFLQKMHDDVPAYGVQVNPVKTLVNFEATVNDHKVTRLVGTRAFPYCGTFIDTETLDISRDRERRKDIGMLISFCFVVSREGFGSD
jgi:telomerase reverse transcriptase